MPKHQGEPGKSGYGAPDRYDDLRRGRWPPGERVGEHRGELYGDRVLCLLGLLGLLVRAGFPRGAGRVERRSTPQQVAHARRVRFQHVA
jgi:hypothetical protein